MFICESCTVRAVVGRELRGPKDCALMALERVRLLDIAHGWSLGTHKQYQGKLQAIRRFEEQYGLRILQAPQLPSPPRGYVIPLAWCQEALSLHPGASRRGPCTLSFTTLRQYRSAVSQFYGICSLATHPDQGLLDSQKRLLLTPCRGTDSLTSHLHATGMGARLGTQTVPSVALLQRHVRTMVQQWSQEYSVTKDPPRRRALVLAILAAHFLWLGWLRAGEVFSLEWADVQYIRPHEGGIYDLPPGMGALVLSLSPETKSNRSQRVDVAISHKTLSGFCPGAWFVKACEEFGYSTDSLPHAPLFRQDNQQSWDSAYFRATFLYPALSRLQDTGDALLRPFTGPAGNTLADKFFSLHSFRRGSRTHVSRRRNMAPGGRVATAAEVYEHARWRYRRNSERIDLIYQEWTLQDRLMLTFYCM